MQSLLLLFRLLLCAHHGRPGVASENWVNANNGRIGSDQDQSVGRLVLVLVEVVPKWIMIMRITHHDHRIRNKIKMSNDQDQRYINMSIQHEH